MALPPIVEGLGNYLNTELGYVIWDGEVPRQDPEGQDVVLEVPADLVIRLTMNESGVDTEWNFENGFNDTGPITVEVFATTRVQAMAVGGQVSTLFANSTNWRAIDLDGDSSFEVYELLRIGWSCIQLEGLRTPNGELIFKCTLRYQVGVRGGEECR
jgi:hypothetical protein